MSEEMKRKGHITFDLETLGNSYNSPIVQIGAVKFNLYGDAEEHFLVNIDPVSLQNLDGIKYHPQTIYWWMNQSQEAKDSVFGDHLDRVPMSNALEMLEEWIGMPSEYVYWSHCTFDPPILANAYRSVGKDNPIPFRNHRDIRTLTHFAGQIDVPRQGTHHNALDDCIYQARYIREGIRTIENK